MELNDNNQYDVPSFTPETKNTPSLLINNKNQNGIKSENIDKIDLYNFKSHKNNEELNNNKICITTPEHNMNLC